MTTIYLIRHAEAEGNLYRRIHGQYNSLVTDNGYSQIAALERRFADIHVDAVYASDLFRTITTAGAISRPRGLQVHTDPDLREISMGDWEDTTWGYQGHFSGDELGQFNRLVPDWKAPNGESRVELGERVTRAIRRIAAAHPDQTVAIVSHGTAIQQFSVTARNMPPERWHESPHTDNTSVNCFTFDGEKFKLIYEGDNSHLDENNSTLAHQNWWKGLESERDINLWFRPIDWQTERNLYIATRSDAWHNTHVNGPAFEPHGFLRDAEEHLAQSPWGVAMAFDRDEWVGIVQMDAKRYSQDNAGYIPFCYIDYQRRDQHLGIQLIGQAVAYFRPMGRDKLRLRCAPYNEHAQHFYRKHGFVKVGEEQGSRVPLDILEKYIGYGK